MVLNSTGILAIARELHRIPMAPEEGLRVTQLIVESHLRGMMLRFHLGLPMVEVKWRAPMHNLSVRVVLLPAEG